LIGQRPALGRDFRADDDRAGAAPVVILGDAIWRGRYGADPNVIGRTVRVNGLASTVVGVMPPSFGFPSSSGLWQPLAFDNVEAMTNRGARSIDAFGRIAAGVSVGQASADLGTIMERLARDYPETNRGIAPRIRPFRELNTGGPMRTAGQALAAAVAFLLLIACANVGNLLLARGTGRAREISVRLSLGATRGQIVSQLLVESLLLASLASVLGIALALAGVRVVDTAIRGTGEPYWLQFPVDWRVLLFFAAVGPLATVMFGLVPALHTSRASIVAVLNEAGRAGTSSRTSRRWSGTLVVVQLALTLVLLTGAGLMMRNVYVQSRIDAGVDTSRLISMRLLLPERQYPTAERRRLFYQRLEDQVAEIPGVQVGIGSWAPLGGAYSRRVSIEGRPIADAGEQPRTSNVFVGTGYFDTIGVRPVRGRTFTRADGGPGAPVTIVNERFASLHFGSEDAVGRRVSLDAAGATAPATGWLTIVGVVPNVRHEESDMRIVEPVVYMPHARGPLPFATVIARSRLDIGAVAGAVRTAVRTLDQDLPVFDVTTVDEALARDLWVPRVFGMMFAVFAVVALALATLGVYAVTAYSVAQRTREIGVRIALGARGRHVWWTVSRRAAFQLALGLTFGGAGALAAGQVLQRVLFSMSGRDPVTLAAVVAVLAAAALTACAVPARRAMRMNPMAALRAE
jgi:putative ABC transport system permease protein